MARAREIPGFAEAATFAEGAARVVEVRSAEVFEHQDGVLRTDEIERVHDMRVATRRLRAALEIFAVCFPRSDHRRLLKEVKALAGALGERRDRDVAIRALDEASGQLTATDRPGLKHLRDELRGEQERANEELADVLVEIERDDLRERLLALAAEARTA